MMGFYRMELFRGDSNGNNCAVAVAFSLTTAYLFPLLAKIYIAFAGCFQKTHSLYRRHSCWHSIIVFFNIYNTKASKGQTDSTTFHFSKTYFFIRTAYIWIPFGERNSGIKTGLRGLNALSFKGNAASPVASAWSRLVVRS